MTFLPGNGLSILDNDTIWDALPSCYAKSNPFSLLGALDIALYRQSDDRFREFAAEAVIQLLDENFGQKDNLDLFTGYFRLFADFVRNQDQSSGKRDALSCLLETDVRMDASRFDCPSLW